MMKTKFVLAFAVAALSVAGAKSYDITFSEPTTVGSVLLPAGHYSVKVDSSNVRFKDLDTGKSSDATAKVGTVNKKFDTTATVANETDGRMKVKEIDLGGTTTKLEFE